MWLQREGHVRVIRCPRMATGDVFLLVIRCPEPECERRWPQSCPYSRAQMTRLLDAGGDIRVYGPACNHSWSLTTDQKNTLRKQFAAGTL